MSDIPKHMGHMDHGSTTCGRIVMSRWDQSERQDNAKDLQRFIKDIQRSGYTHSRIERFQGDLMPDWVGQSCCDDKECKCWSFQPIGHRA